jgi:hypothetical protein
MPTFSKYFTLPIISKLPVLIIVLSFVSTSFSESTRGCKFYYSQENAHSSVGSRIKDALLRSPESHLEYLISNVLSAEV